MLVIRLVKSGVRFLPAVICLMLIHLTVNQETLMAQGQSQVSCHEVTILGAVMRPARLEIQAPKRLAEVLKNVGGPSDRAGKIVRVFHPCTCSPCPEDELRAPVRKEYDLSAALQGRDEANPLVVPGDLIIVPEGELVWVIGNVVSQRSLIYREGVTLKRAIAMVGGVAKQGDLVRIRIHRNPSTHPAPNPPSFNLKAVLDNRSDDPVLQPSDIIEISDETGNFRLPMSPPLLDPPLTPPPGDPPLIQRRSSNC